MPYLAVFEIEAGAIRTISLPFANKLPSGVGFALSGHSVAAVEHWGRTTANSILGSLTPTVSGTDVSAVILNVSAGQRYEVTFTLTLNDATPSVIKEKILVIGVDAL
jgi:hypothetical protein